jgi:hypothetical protein
MRLHGSQPAAKAIPDERGMACGEVEEQALCNASELDVGMVGADLPVDVRRYSAVLRWRYWFPERLRIGVMSIIQKWYA